MQNIRTNDLEVLPLKKKKKQKRHPKSSQCSHHASKQRGPATKNPLALFYRPCRTRSPKQSGYSTVDTTRPSADHPANFDIKIKGDKTGFTQASTRPHKIGTDFHKATQLPFLLRKQTKACQLQGSSLGHRRLRRSNSELFIGQSATDTSSQT